MLINWPVTSTLPVCVIWMQGWFRSAACWLWGEGRISLQLPQLQCNFREVREQAAEAARQAAPQKILEGEKYQGVTNIPRHWAIRTALLMLTPPPAVTQSSTKSICCFVVLVVCLCVGTLWCSLFVNLWLDNGGSTQSPKCVTWWILTNKSICSTSKRHHCKSQRDSHQMQRKRWCMRVQHQQLLQHCISFSSYT